MLRLKLRRALLAGFVGALIVVPLATLGEWLLRFDPRVAGAARSGELTVLSVGSLAVLLALLVMAGALLAPVYALVFEYVTRAAGWAVGAILGVLHGAAMWLALGLLVWWLPSASEFLHDEIFAVFNSAWAVGGVVFLHAVFGALVGAIYGTPLHRPEERREVLMREVALQPTVTKVGGT